MRGSSDDEGYAKNVEAIYIDRWPGSVCVRGSIQWWYTTTIEAGPMAWRHVYRNALSTLWSVRIRLKPLNSGVEPAKENIMRRRRLELFVICSFIFKTIFLRNYLNGNLFTKNILNF